MIGHGRFRKVPRMVSEPERRVPSPIAVEESDSDEFDEDSQFYDQDIDHHRRRRSVRDLTSGGPSFKPTPSTGGPYLSDPIVQEKLRKRFLGASVHLYSTPKSFSSTGRQSMMSSLAFSGKDASGVSGVSGVSGMGGGARLNDEQVVQLVQDSFAGVTTELITSVFTSPSKEETDSGSNAGRSVSRIEMDVSHSELGSSYARSSITPEPRESRGF
jgi:hypothetical protein